MKDVSEDRMRAGPKGNIKTRDGGTRRAKKLE